MLIHSHNRLVLNMVDKLDSPRHNHDKMVKALTNMLPKWEKHKDEWILYQKIILLQSFVLLISLLFHVVFDILSHG